jgi:hypothetical protein
MYHTFKKKCTLGVLERKHAEPNPPTNINIDIFFF